MSKLNNVIVGKIPEPPRVVLYGEHGVWKTSIASHLPKPIIVQTEKGASQIECPKFPVARSYLEARENLEALVAEQHTYKTVILDSLDWLERLIFSEVAAKQGVADIGEIDFGKGYHTATSYWKEVFALLDTLQEKRRMMICLLAHATVAKYESPDSQGYDIITIDLHKQVRSSVIEWADCVLYIAQDRILDTKKGAFGKEVTKATGTGDRIIHTTGKPAFVAKNRYGLPPEVQFSSARQGAEMLVKGIFAAIPKKGEAEKKSVSGDNDGTKETQEKDETREGVRQSNESERSGLQLPKTDGDGSSSGNAGSGSAEGSRENQEIDETLGDAGPQEIPAEANPLMGGDQLPESFN